ncbi:MAG TPA: Ger(x)C family spore germination protein [Symbiobacteriaceae bacterium]
MFARALALLALLLVTTGCWSRVEVNELAIVTLMAVDQTEDGDLAVWLQIALPERAGAATGAIGGSDPRQGLPVILLTGKGRTILDAATHIQHHLSRRLFWAHMRVVLVGERLAKNSIRPALDFLTRHRELRLTNYLLVVPGDVAEFVRSLVDLERLPAEYLREIARQRLGLTVNVGEFARMMASPGAQAVTAVADVIRPSASFLPRQQALLGIVGAALFQGDKLVGYLDEHNTQGLLMLRGQDHRGTLTFQPSESPGSVTIQWWNVRTERKASLTNGEITIRVRARLEADISDSPANLDLSDPSVIRSLERQAAELLRQRMKNAMERLRELNVDAAGFGELVHRQMPAVWKRVEEEWLSTEARQVRTVFEAEVHIRRTGLSNKPRGVPDEVLEKGGRGE